AIAASMCILVAGLMNLGLKNYNFGLSPFVYLFVSVSILIILLFKRRKIESDLQQERDFTQNLFDANPAFLIVLDTHGMIKLVNHAMLNATGCSLDEVLGKDYLRTFISRSPEDNLPWVFRLKLGQQKLVQTEEKS
ncbi:MAG: PAS domain S-box protein, partial [Oscillatoriales cyanobacterium RM1_1_9]|nr:PAS domain S-box protein [Oscillatoriales cyanobacterium RM1_1_9]